MKLADRKLDILGYIKSFLGVQYDPDRLRSLTNKLELRHSLASISNAKTKESAAHNVAGKAAGEAETRMIVPAAKNKLTTRGMDMTKLTKKEIIDVLEVYYGTQETAKKNKPILAELLKS
jgi:hypothetical protein